MSKAGVIVELPSAAGFFRQFDRLVKIQALAGDDVKPLYAQGMDAGIFRAECIVPGFGQLFMTRSVYESSGYSIIDCTIFDDVDSPDRAPVANTRHLTFSRLSEDAPWILHGEQDGIDAKDIEQLNAFAQESPKEVFERLFDEWFYDYSGIVPDSFTLANIEHIYNSSAPQS